MENCEKFTFLYPARYYDLAKHTLMELKHCSIYFSNGNFYNEFDTVSGIHGSGKLLTGLSIGDLVSVEQIVGDAQEAQVVLESGIAVSPSDFHRLELFVSQYMQKEIEESQQKAQKIIDAAKNLLADETNLLYFTRFIEKYALVIYCHPQLLSKMNAVFWINYCTAFAGKTDEYGIKYLLSSDTIDRLAEQEFRVDSNGMGQISIKDSDFLDEYFKDGLRPFIVLIQEKNNLDFGAAPFIVYAALQLLVQNMVAENWEKNYGKYFPNVSSKSLEECVLDYLKIPDISTDHLDTLAKFTYYLRKQGKLGNEPFSESFIMLAASYQKLQKEEESNQRKKQLENILFCDSNESSKHFSINDIDMMTGTEFEKFIASYFEKIGYSAQLTKGSGDQGIDVIIRKDGVKIGIQAKCYSGSVGNSAVQEAIAGRGYYQLDKVMVITNSVFTSAAIELAQINDVVLWDRDVLREKLNQ